MLYMSPWAEVASPVHTGYDACLTNMYDIAGCRWPLCWPPVRPPCTSIVPYNCSDYVRLLVIRVAPTWVATILRLAAVCSDCMCCLYFTYICKTCTRPCTTEHKVKVMVVGLSCYSGLTT